MVDALVMDERTEKLVMTLDSFADAAQSVIDAWESGNLALAVSNLEAHMEDARDVVKRAQGEG